MLHKYPISVPRVASSASLVAGMLLWIAAGNRALFANELGALSGQGSSLNAAELHAASPAMQYSQAIAWQIMLGSLLILLGFMFHAYWVVRAHRSPSEKMRTVK